MPNVVYQGLLVAAAIAAVGVNLAPGRPSSWPSMFLAAFNIAIIVIMLTDFERWPEHQPWAGLTLAVVSLGSVATALRRRDSAKQHAGR